MNLSTLIIPQVSEEMIKTYRDYYRTFYLEMVRMSNSNLNTYINDFIDLVTQLAKNGRKQDIVRSAIGIVALHDFGYNDFNQLSSIFDRLLPQKDLELVKFTSWCAGQLTHHPTAEKSRYASHLFHRLIEWTRSKGRRNRNLAAAHLLNSLSLQCGSVVVVFFPALQSFIWRLLSDKSMDVLNATADAVENFTFSVIRYTRSDLKSYLDFFSQLCQNLLMSVGDSTSKYMALLLLKKLISSAPDDYVTEFFRIYTLISESTVDEPLFVQSIAYGIMASLAEVDPKQFINVVSNNFFNRTPELLSAHPYETVESLCLLVRVIPSYMKDHFDLLEKYVLSIIESPNSVFLLLKTIYQAYGANAFTLPDDILFSLLQAPVTEEYKDFIITYSNTFAENNQKVYLDSLIKELKSDNPLLSIEIFAEIPRQYLTKHSEILETLKSLKYVKNTPTRKAIPRAMFNLARMCDNLPYKYIINEMFHFALYDPALEVRSTALSVLLDNVDSFLASPEYMKFFQVFVNDDATTVRRLSLNLLEKLVVYNPAMVTAITRNALLDSFFVMRKVPSIRQRSRTAKCLPDLIKASSRTIKIYSSGFMEIAINAFKNREKQNQKFENFLEVHAYNRYFISLLSSVSLLAKMDPEQVAKHGHFLIMFLCNRLENENDYNIILNILNLIYVLLSAPASCLIYRAHTPLILSSVTLLLAKTDSLNERFACLKIIGAVGVLEVHQKPTTVACVSPPHIDDSLARQFYHPSRDSETVLDDANLLKESTVQNYYKNFAANAVLEIFNDESLSEYYFESVQALVNIFKKPTDKQYSSADAMLGYFDQFVHRLLDVLMESSDYDLKIYLPLYANLINNMTDDISPFVKRTLELINKRFNQELAPEILQVILELLEALKDAFSPYASETICLLIGILDYSMTTDYVLSRYVLQAFSIIGIYASDLLYLIIPQICESIECEQTMPKVRVYAFHALSILTKSVDLFAYLGPILRALELGLFHQDSQTNASAFDFLYSLLQAEGSMFLKSMNPLLQKIKSKHLETKELRNVIENINFPTFRPILVKNTKTQSNQHSQDKIFSEDAITLKAITPLLGGEQHLEQWLRSFMLTVVSNSPSDEIRACTILAASYNPLSVKLFNVAFLSCWDQLSPVAQHQITESFRGLLASNDTYDTVSHEIIKLLVFMDKIERPLDIPVDELVEACVRYRGAAFALLLTNRRLDDNPDDIKSIEKCIDLYAQLNSWPNAIGMWNKSKMKSSNLNKVDMLVKLKRWDQAKIIYQQHLEKRKDIDSLVGLAQSLSALAMWEDILCLYGTFKKLSRPFKARVAPYLAQAAMRLGEFKILDDVLESAPETSLPCTFLAALNALHKKEYKNVEQFVAQGFTLIASSPIAFLADDQQLHHDIMVKCQELVEIKEMKDWATGGFRKEIEEVWNERLKTAPRDFDMWFGIIANRASFIEINDNNMIKFFSMQSATLGTKLHTNAFESIFPSFDWETAPDLQKVCYVVAEWNTGKKKEALKKMSELTTTLSGNLLLRCQLIYSNWVLIVDQSLDGLKSAFNHLKSIIEAGVPRDTSNNQTSRMRRTTSESTTGLILPVQIFKELTSNTTSVDLLRKWRDVNLALFSTDKDNSRLYIIQAIDALARCSQLQPTFPDTVLLLNLFFENAHIPEIFNSQAQKCIESLPPKLLIQASPQLLVQLSHQSKNVADFVHDIVIKLLDVHYHELLFAVIVLTKSKDANRSRCAHLIFEEFQSTHPEVAEQVLLIRKCLLRAARTWPEMMSDYINSAVELLKPLQLPKLRKILETITEMGINERAKCQMHVQFQKEYGKSIHELESILESLVDENSQEQIQKVDDWCRNVQLKLNEELKQITTIQMSSISTELCERTHFLLAVFGTYKPNRPIIPIQYFVGQFSVFMTKQQPKDVVVKGEDGNFYQYLLKGHEDLRLDERIMQFFRLINVLLMKKSSFNSNYIQTICVIPLSNAHGLIQWVPGAETLRTIVENYRLLHDVDPMLEYSIATTLTDSNYDYLQPIQKMQIIDWIFNETPDTDLANYFWLKAPSAEMWMKTTNTFAISTAINSIVGYIIGLGDRHPSNLLIDRNTGKVIHIDFGDCFEKAMKRTYLPEVVPFRLTRMMVKAFGAPGVDGTFRSSFIDMSTLLRANSRILILVLAVFVHEPLVDPKELDPNEELMQCSAASGIFVDKMMVPKDKTDTTSEIRIRVGEKLSGKEIKEGEELSVEEQASILIDMATNRYNLSQMYSGWCPFW